MLFTPLSFAGAWQIDLQPIQDERGFFARSWCSREFAEHGLDARLEQCNVSFNLRRGTLRGMHYQAAPHGEAKLVRCTRGAVFDVIIDLRHGSATYMQWQGVSLSADNHRSLFIPIGFAHGFQTLTDNCELSYQMSTRYQDGLARGVRWNDPAFNIDWPLPLSIISAQDSGYPDFNKDIEAQERTIR